MPEMLIPTKCVFALRVCERLNFPLALSLARVLVLSHTLSRSLSLYRARSLLLL
jgi:hypothetical protein